MIEKIYADLDKYIKDALFFEDLPGLVISAGHIESIEGAETEDSPCRDSTLREALKGFAYSRAAGVSDISDGTPLTPEHIFHMVSVSKLFTGAAIMLLVEKGKLLLEDKVVDILKKTYIDDKRYKDITIRHMLTHTSGIGDVHDYQWNMPRWDERALEDYANSSEIKNSRLLWGPEEMKFSYSNIAYELLGLVVQNVSGISYEEFIRRYIFQPLGMTNSTMITPERISAYEAKFEDLTDFDKDYELRSARLIEELKKAGLAMPHIKDEGKHIIKAEHYPYNRMHAPSSTLTTNAGDLKKWAAAHLRREFFSESTYDNMWQEHVRIPNNGGHMGFSWFIRKQRGYTLYGHEGTDVGFRAGFWICPELMLYIIATSNSALAPMKKINKKVFDIILSSLHEAQQLKQIKI